MPAIITHDQFGRKALAKAAAGVVSNERERNAFLLGNQGPDPLFYCVANPTTAKYHKLGNLMHHADPSALLFSLAQSLVYLPEAAHPLAKAYIAGFLCHSCSTEPSILWYTRSSMLCAMLASMG